MPKYKKQTILNLMIRFISGFLFIFAACVLVFVTAPLELVMQTKQERLSRAWQNDFDQLSKDPKFAKVFANLSKVDVHFTDPQVAEEFKNFKTPFRVSNPEGFILKIDVTRWIEPKEYGFVIQHELFDQSDDKLYEFGRTYKIGIIL